MDTITNLSNITLHSFDANGNCLADATLPSGTRVCNFKVMPGPGGGVMVHMPAVMGTTWTFTDIAWVQVRQQITAFYREFMQNKTPENAGTDAPQPLEVRLYDFDEKRNCLADIVIRESGTQVSGLKVMQGLGGGVMVHMPAWMHTKWSFAEIAWSTVRQIVSAQYLKERDALPAAPAPAEADLPKPAEEEPAESVTPAPAEEPAPAEAEEAPEPETEAESDTASDEEPEAETPAPAPTAGTPATPLVPKPYFQFHSFSVRKEALARVVINETGTVVTDVYVACFNDETDRAFAKMPFWMHNQWSVQEMAWADFSALVVSEYRRQICKETLRPVSDITVQFSAERTNTSCLVDAFLPNRRGCVKNFRLHHYDNESPRIGMPSWMQGLWQNDQYPWNVLCNLIITAYRRIKHEPFDISDTEDGAQPITNPAAPASTEPKTAENRPQQTPKNCTAFGRVRNAKNSNFCFYPRTVLRKVPDPSEKTSPFQRGYNQRPARPAKTFNEFDLVRALNSPIGGIGSFEINILIWVEKLRYVKTTMLLDLIESGYISLGSRVSISQDKLADTLRRMRKYDLIDLTQFVTLEDNNAVGQKDEVCQSKANFQIITLGKTGNTLLHELGKNTRSYNPFDIMQDGNTVKRYLTSNQWLIYWLKTCKNIGENYETACVLYQKGSEYSGARFYATVTLDDAVMVAEPVRRVEEFEIEARRTEFRAKVGRLVGMFGNLDQLYNGKDEIVFPSRPILVLICEDDAHMDKTREVIADIAAANPEQQIWFTTDCRVFNDNMAGKRFLREAEGALTVVDIEALFGVAEEIHADLTEEEEEDVVESLPEGEDEDDSPAGKPAPDEDDFSEEDDD